MTLALASRRIPATGPAAVRVSNANGFQVTGKLSGHSAKKVSASRKRRVGLRSRPFTVGAHGKTTVRLGLPNALRKLLKRNHRLSLRLRARVSDPAGHTRTVTKTLTPRVKRKRMRRH